MSESLDLDAIKARLAAATPGPWVTNPYRKDVFAWLGEITWKGGTTASICDCGNSNRPTEDADFIANAPTDIAALLAEVERLRKLAEYVLYEEPSACCGCGSAGRVEDAAAAILRGESIED